VNRSSKGIEFVGFGCAKVQERKAYVIGELVGVGTSHGGVGPNHYYEPFKVLNGPLNQWTDEKMGCEKNAKMVVIKAVFADRTEWKADGSDWIER
jgi:hypothetical protein